MCVEGDDGTIRRRMIGAEVYSVVCWLFGYGLVALLVVLIVPSFLSFLAMPGLCCFLCEHHLVWVAIPVAGTTEALTPRLCMQPVHRRSEDTSVHICAHAAQSGSPILRYAI